MYTLQSKSLRFSVEENGRVCSLINLKNGREYIQKAVDHPARTETMAANSIDFFIL